ncbi:hypothetical protein EJ110_NYTH03355 [Nymphaea thermarum]|nr:hypothetical protein EJ110_NYTH03355 [Nymphaea thermarum]
MALGPVVSGAVLAEHEVVRPENLAVRPGPQAVHGARLEIHQHRAGHVPPTAGLVVVHVHAFELELGVPNVTAPGVDAMFITHHLPKLGTDLVSTLPRLNMKDLSHLPKASENVQKTFRKDDTGSSSIKEAPKVLIDRVRTSRLRFYFAKSAECLEEQNCSHSIHYFHQI